MTGMALKDLLAGMDVPASMTDIRVHGLTLDSRAVRQGDAFVALQGLRQHGMTFAPAALASGASVILAEAPAPVVSTDQPVLWLDGLRDRVGHLAAQFYGQPSQKLRLVGVTGTNGKTSTVQLLAQALEHLGRRAATIGTLGAGLHGAIREGERTTPDAIAVQSLLADFRAAGATDVAMEVSSHALEQGRVNAVGFGVAVFTNLTRDHLDYHGTMHAYGAAKARLFSWPGLRHAVINVDDAFGRELAQRVPASVNVIRCGTTSSDADVRATAIVTNARGLSFHLVTPWGEAQVDTRLLGRFNVSNLLGVIGALAALDLPFADIVNAVETLQPVSGRMNRLGGDGALPLVVIDYAHTPDALEQALATLRAHCEGRLVCVFGCGGERDVGKRPQMAAIAERLADSVIVTDDNPRGEDGDAIVRDILGGIAQPNAIVVQRDRAAAIGLAIRAAQASDVVLIAGKGHEAYQEIAGRKLPFDDLVVARAALEARA
jgi:UDP-N-acetylmuramoyl-L-alanyl-D-glutamate--2,6-diaminopimelate ligase